MSVKKNSITEKLEIGGALYTTRLTAKFRNRKNWEKPDDSRVVAVIPGTIREVYVSEGDTVEPGTALLILEAMKMRNEVVATRPGKVVSVNIKEGELVPKNHLLVKLD